MLIEADSRGKRKVGTHAYEHPAPARVPQVEVELVHPALLVLQRRAFVVLISDGHQNARRFPCFEDRDHWVGFGMLEVCVQEPIPPALVTIALRRFENRSAPFFAPVLQPILERVGDFRQGFPGYPLPCAVGIEETEHAFRLLERLNQAVKQQPVKTPIPELDAILGMLVKGSWHTLLCGEIPGGYRRERLLGLWPLRDPHGRFRICWYGKRPTASCWRYTLSPLRFPSRRLTVFRYRCVGQRYPFPLILPKDSVAAAKRTRFGFSISPRDLSKNVAISSFSSRILDTGISKSCPQ